MGLAELISIFPGLFGDRPLRTHLLEHDIEVGEAKPTKHCFYCVSADKCKYVDAEISGLPHVCLSPSLITPSDIAQIFVRSTMPPSWMHIYFQG